MQRLIESSQQAFGIRLWAMLQLREIGVESFTQISLKALQLLGRGSGTQMYTFLVTVPMKVLGSVAGVSVPFAG